MVSIAPGGKSINLTLIFLASVQMAKEGYTMKGDSKGGQLIAQDTYPLLRS
jgi:hypothetical protein